MLNRRSRFVLAFAVLTAGSGAVLADDPHKPSAPTLDDELLEFLGSVDPTSDTSQPDDGSWIEYLSQTDIGKVAKPGNPTVIAAKPATPATPPPAKPSAPGAKQNE
ncbi:MAG TPA: hypothetical protein VGC34_17860 [Steroidobacteraceae bacterium]